MVGQHTPMTLSNHFRDMLCSLLVLVSNILNVSLKAVGIKLVRVNLIERSLISQVSRYECEETN